MSEDPGGTPTEPPSEPEAAETDTAPRPVRLVLREPERLRRSRLTAFLRWLLALPHLVWLVLWSVAAAFVVLVAWLGVLVDARVPRSIHDFLARYLRYSTHVAAYLLLVSDRYPGFAGDPGYEVDVEIDPPARQSRWSGLLRLVLAAPAILLSFALGVPGGSWNVPGLAVGGGLAAVVALLGWFVAVLRARMPRGLRDAAATCLAYATEVNGYTLLLTGTYPCADPASLLPGLELPPHPVRLENADDPRRSRLVVLLRLPLAAPHLVWATLWTVPALAAALVGWVAALVTGRVPRALHRFLTAYVRYAAHVGAFLYVIGGPFPGFVGRAGSYPVDVDLPEAARQSRWTVLFRGLLALPTLLVASAYGTVALVVGVLLWFAGLATGRAPAGLQALGAATLRYSAQTTAYLLLLTGRYPDAGPAGSRAAEPGHPLLPLGSPPVGEATLTA